MVLIGKPLRKEREVQVDFSQTKSSESIRLTANKNWKKGLTDLFVLIHIRFKFSTRKVDIGYRLNSGG